MSPYLQAAQIEAMLSSVLMIPCRPDVKRPPMSGWPTKGSNDQEQLTKLFEQFPDCILSVLTGGPSGVWLIDVDYRHGGKESLAALEANVGPLPRKCHYWTPKRRAVRLQMAEGCCYPWQRRKDRTRD